MLHGLGQGKQTIEWHFSLESGDTLKSKCVCVHVRISLRVENVHQLKHSGYPWGISEWHSLLLLASFQ